MTKKQKKLLTKIVLSLVCFIVAFFMPNLWLKGGFSVLSFLICGYPVLVRAVKNVLSKNLLDEHFLMTVATIGAFCIGEFTEGAAVMLFYQIGELFQSIAVSKSRKSISDLMDICPEHANLQQNGAYIEVAPEQVKPGDTILIKPGERIPVDCIVTDGRSDLDTKAITGESKLTAVEQGDTLISGSVNLNGVLTCEAVRAYENSAVSKILALVEESSNRKSTYESFIHRFAVIYTPIVVLCALLLAVIPSLLFGNVAEWVRRGLTFLVVSCPCALVISVPLTFFGGLGRASAMGILVKGGNFLEALAKCDTVIFDKTGTLTTGGFFVTELEANGVTKETLLQIAASAEQASTHPVSKAVTQHFSGALLPTEQIKELPGRGVSAVVNGKTVLVGNKALLEEQNIAFSEKNTSGTMLYVAQNNVYLGAITVSDKVKSNAKKIIQTLQNQGKNVVMLTGDVAVSAKETAEALGICQYYFSLLPQDKVKKTEEIKKSSRKKVMFVGDGINDAPVMALSDISVSMGALGSDAAIEASDIVLTDDDLEKLPKAFRLAKKTVAIAKQNVTIALGVKLLVLLLSAFGFVNLWAAVFADVGVAVIAILNAIRILNGKMTKL